MRMLAGMGIFQEVNFEAYEPTSLAQSYVSGNPLSDIVVHLWGDILHLPITFLI